MKKYIILGILTLLSIGCANSADMELEGKLVVKGTSTHTYLVIEDAKTHKNYKIQNAKSFHLMQKQKEYVKIKAKFIKKAIAPGFPVVVEAVEVD